MGHRWGVPDVFRALVRLVDQFARAFDLAQLPRRHGEQGQRQGSGVVAETFPRLLSSARSQRDRASRKSPETGTVRLGRVG